MSKAPLQIVWFKRDFRVVDHEALSAAAQRGPVLPLYIVERDYWRQPDASRRHWVFAREALEELRRDLAQLGQPLVIRQGDAINVMSELHDIHGIAALWSHMESGNKWTFDRDRRLAAWCRANGIVWNEPCNFGVQRRMASRNGWAAKWEAQMRAPQRRPPRALTPLVGIDLGQLPSADDLRLEDDGAQACQIGGRIAAEGLLGSFLTQRGREYRKAMSSPLDGADACSRLSPHLTWGTLSVREVAQAVWARQRALDQTQDRGAWAGSLSSFMSRLHWHCHFIQKLEDAPRIEWENLHPAYDGLRPVQPDQARLNAWQHGETGLPFLDACMRSLRATGWLNFRMRAMVMAVASYHLWLHWRAPGLHLARMFTDYEPGIHWSQVQMQSGTTGINTIRVYNPVKQGLDQDPQGTFIARWVPELAALPPAARHRPWAYAEGHKLIGNRYPEPIVEPMAAAKAAREQLWQLRKSPDHRAAANAIVARLASRSPARRKRSTKRGSTKATAQLSLPFDGVPTQTRE